MQAVLCSSDITSMDIEITIDTGFINQLSQIADTKLSLKMSLFGVPVFSKEYGKHLQQLNI